MAHIRRHPVDKTKWQVRYIDPVGRERSKTFPRKVDADKYLIHVEGQKQRAEWIDPKRSATRFEELAERWLASRSHLKPRTFEGYHSLLRVHILPALGSLRLDRIDRLTVESWMAERKAAGLSASRRRQAFQVFRQILDAAVEDRYLPSNPAIGVKLPKLTQREQLFLEPEEVAEIAALVPEQFRALLYIFGCAGLRWGEAVALRRRRVDVLRSRLEVTESMSDVAGQLIFGPTKNYRNLTIVLPRFLRDMLNGHLLRHTASGTDGLLFTAENGSPLRNSNFNRRVWKPTVEQAGLPEGLRIHDLRHSAVAFLISQGAHPEAIKRYMGHSSISVTMDVYGHLFPSDAEDLADKLNELFRRSQTDKIRTKRPLTAVLVEGTDPGNASYQGVLFAPSGGLEPPTPGLGNPSEGSDDQDEDPESQ
jgi:integrase